MTKLNELIAELCPDGVEYKTLGEVCEEIIVPMRDRPKVFDGNIPWCRIEDKEGQYFHKSLSGLGVSDKVIKEMNLKVFPTGTVICSCSASLGAYAINTQPLITNQTFIGLVCGKELFNKFLLYFMETQTTELRKLATTGTIPYISRQKFEQLQIPVPPLAVQEEIVRILDKFTELEKELEKELENRRKQYEYYRDKLLTFENTGGGDDYKVEWKTLSEIFDTRNGYTPSTSNPDFWENGTIPWFVMDDIRKNGRVLSQSIQHVTKSAVKKSGLFPANSIIIATSATIGEHALITTDFLCNQRFTCLSPKSEFKNQIDMKFMFYYAFKLDEFCKKNTTVSSFASVDMSKFYDFQFPLPPLTVQQRIVSVLDNFDAICADLKIGLPAEIEARKKQYEYYRDKLLSFDTKVNIGIHGGGISDEIKLLQYVFGYAVVRLGDVATDIYRGSGITRDQVTADGSPCVRYGEIYTTYGVWFDKCVSHTQISKISSPKYFEHGDILFAITGESVEDIAKSTAYVGNEKCLAGGDIVVLKHNQNPKYLSYALSTYDAQKQKGQGKVKSKVVHSSVPAISNITIPLPPLSVQDRIVQILDRFESLCNDIVSGLPAEIEARKKQYEYYRDLLLNFKRK